MRNIWYILTTRCAEADRLRSIAATETLTRSERIAMRLHESICKSCRRAAEQVRKLDAAIQTLRTTDEEPTPATDQALSPAARDRLRARLSEIEK